MASGHFIDKLFVVFILSWIKAGKRNFAIFVVQLKIWKLNFRKRFSDGKFDAGKNGFLHGVCNF